MKYSKSFLGSAAAFVLATSCCWLPALIVLIGGGSTLLGLSKDLEHFSSVFMVIGLTFLGYGIYQYQKSRNMEPAKTILQSVITCPACGFKKEETMPTNACQYFYECESCKKVLKPTGQDCCVYCSYGTVPCPPIQNNEDCC